MFNMSEEVWMKVFGGLAVIAGAIATVVSDPGSNTSKDQVPTPERGGL